MSRARTCDGSVARRMMVLLGLLLVAHGVAHGQAVYTLQPIIKGGEQVGDLKISKGSAYFWIGTLNDSGQLVFTATNAASASYLLIQYDNGKFTPIVAPGKDAPVGKWPNVFIFGGRMMNQRGDIVFGVGAMHAQSEDEGDDQNGTYLWDYKAQQVTVIARPGTPAVNDLTFTRAGHGPAAINNNNEIVLEAEVENGNSPRYGVFFLDRDRRLQPVALQGQELPDGQRVRQPSKADINDAGVVAFVERPRGGIGLGPGENAYIWQHGAITPVAWLGMDVPGGGKLGAVGGIWVNNQNPTVLVAARLQDSRNFGLYRSTNGQLTPVVVPGQEMPGGGKFRTLQDQVGFAFSVSSANDAGAHAFLAILEDRSTAAYRVEADGKLSLILKSGTTTDLGQITLVGWSQGLSTVPGLNNKGQVALPIRIDNGLETIVLLTPAAP